jgi:hypothetical protein
MGFAPLLTLSLCDGACITLFPAKNEWWTTRHATVVKTAPSKVVSTHISGPTNRGCMVFLSRKEPS